MADVPLRPLEVFAVDEDMNRASGTIPYTSLTWSRRYHECGQFSMVVPADVYDPSWAYIYADARPETGIVQKVEYSDTAHTPDGIDTVTVSGFFLECLLNRLTFLVEQPEEQTIEIKVPEPRKPGLTKAQIPQNVYWDPETDSYYYQNSEGDLIDRNGEQVDGESRWVHLEVQIQSSNRVDDTPVAMPSDTYTSNYYWVEADDPNNVHLKNEMTGLTHVYPVEIRDDKGNVYYHSSTQDVNKIYVASSAITKGAQDAYFAAMRDWTASGGVRYETITVKGPWQRTDMMEPVTESDSVEQLLTWIRRFFGTTFVYEEPTIEGVVKTLDPSLQRMGDFAYSVLQEVGASLRVVYNFVGNSMVLHVYRGKDRTQAGNAPKVAALADEPVGGNPWAVFSDTWGTIYDYTASRDTSNYRNICYVLYSYDQPKSFESDGTPHLEEVTEVQDDGTVKVLGWEVPYETKRGYQVARVNDELEADRECYLDLRESGGAPSCDSQWSRDRYAYDESQPNYGKPTFEPMQELYEQWPDALTAKGVAELQQSYGVVTNLDTGTVVTSGYMRDWDLGDVVEFGVSTVGLMSQARIIGVDEVYESGRADIRIEVGDQLLTDLKKAKLN